MHQDFNSPNAPDNLLGESLPKLDPLELKAALYQTINRSIPTAALILSFLHTAYAASHVLASSNQIKAFMLPLDSLTALFYLMVFWITYKKLISAEWAHVLAGIFGIITSFNILTHLALSGNPFQAINLILLIITIGALFLSYYWFWLVLSVSCFGWLIIAFNTPASAIWAHFGVGLLLATIISILLQRIRHTTYTRLYELTLLNTAKEQYLLQAQVQLEARVEQRTQELALLNFELQDEVMRRQQVEEQLKEEEQIIKTERNNLEETVIKRTAALSKANVQLTHAMSMRDAFVANMSHELRTPLNSILGNSEILQENLYGQLNNRQLSAVNRIESSGRHLLSLISDILDVSKIESGRFKIQLAPINISALCRSSISMVKTAAGHKNINISLVLDPAVKMVIIDSRRIKQVLVNLLSNAVKFTPEGGRIGLIVRGQPSEYQVRIMVWDTGIGIQSKHLKKLFKPFVQLDSSLSKEHEGTGLGLSLSRQLVELHDGSIDVKSQLNKGSLFVVTLPWSLETRSYLGDTSLTNDGNSAEPAPIDTDAPTIIESQLGIADLVPLDANPSEIIEWIKQSENFLSPLEPLESMG